MIKKIFTTVTHGPSLDFGLLVFRVVISLLMLTHGWGKAQMLLSDGAAQFPDPLGVGNFMSLLLVVFAEFGCSLLILVGLGTRLATIPLIITMIVAAVIIHGSDPIDKKELALIYMVSYALLFLSGSGRYSLDRLISK